MFEVENLDCHVPRLCFKACFESDIKDWSKQVSDSINHVDVGLFWNVL